MTDSRLSLGKTIFRRFLIGTLLAATNLPLVLYLLPRSPRTLIFIYGLLFLFTGIAMFFTEAWVRHLEPYIGRFPQRVRVTARVLMILFGVAYIAWSFML